MVSPTQLCWRYHSLPWRQWWVAWQVQGLDQTKWIHKDHSELWNDLCVYLWRNEHATKEFDCTKEDRKWYHYHLSDTNFYAMLNNKMLSTIFQIPTFTQCWTTNFTSVGKSWYPGYSCVYQKINILPHSRVYSKDLYYYHYFPAKWGKHDIAPFLYKTVISNPSKYWYWTNCISESFNSIKISWKKWLQSLWPFNTPPITFFIAIIMIWKNLLITHNSLLSYECKLCSSFVNENRALILHYVLQGYIAVIILGMGSANEIQCCKLMACLIGWTQTEWSLCIVPCYNRALFYNDVTLFVYSEKAIPEFKYEQCLGITSYSG